MGRIVYWFQVYLWWAGQRGEAWRIAGLVWPFIPFLIVGAFLAFDPGRSGSSPSAAVAPPHETAAETPSPEPTTAAPPATTVEPVATPTEAPPPTATPAVALPSPTPPPQERSYTIAPGDTLYAICLTQAPDLDPDACVAEIVALNSLSSADQISTGQVLRLP